MKRGRWMVRLEWKPQDGWVGCWVGAFWCRMPWKFDLWVCVLPMVPLHVTWTSDVDEDGW